MPSFSDANELRLPLALPPGVGEPGFAPFGAPLRVGIWLCGPSEERISRDAGGRALEVCEPPFLLDLKRKDIISLGRLEAGRGAFGRGRGRETQRRRQGRDHKRSARRSCDESAVQKMLPVSAVGEMAAGRSGGLAGSRRLRNEVCFFPGPGSPQL